MNEAHSRIFRLRGVLEHANNSTACGLRSGLFAHQSFDAKKLFVDSYPAIYEGLTRYTRLGVLVLVFDDRATLSAEGWIEASLDRSRTAILGRHTRAALCVPDSEEAISLRHLAFVVRATSHDEARVRVLDLQSGLGFATETGCVLEGVISEGSFFLSIGKIRIAILVTGDGEPPFDAHAAYACIPERVYFDEREKRFGLRPMGPQKASPRATMVRTQIGPLNGTDKLLLADERAVARIAIDGRGMRVEREIGSIALNRGFIIGRYSRCDLRTSVDSEKISRVHALIVHHEGEDMIIDAASSNGTRLDNRDISAAALNDKKTIALGGDHGITLTYERL